MTKTLSVAVTAHHFEYLTITLDSLVKQSQPVVISVIHDLADADIQGIIRHYPQIIRSLDNGSSDSVCRAANFGDYFCHLQAGDVVSQDWAKEAMEVLHDEPETTMFMTLTATLDADGNVVDQPHTTDIRALLAEAYANKMPTNALCVVESGKHRSVKLGTTHLSDRVMAGMRLGSIRHQATLIDRLNGSLLASNPRLILDALAHDTDRHTAAHLFVKMIKTALSSRYFVLGLWLLFVSVVNPGYRRPILRALLQPNTAKA